MKKNENTMEQKFEVHGKFTNIVSTYRM